MIHLAALAAAFLVIGSLEIEAQWPDARLDYFVEFSSAKARPMSVRELAAAADTIVLGTVVERLELEGTRLVQVEVKSVLKGSPGPTLTVLAESTWLCDESSYKLLEGEQLALLFISSYRFGWFEDLAPPEDPRTWKEPPGLEAAVAASPELAPLSKVVNSGQGAMPVRTVDGQLMVERGHGVVTPLEQYVELVRLWVESE